MNEEQLSQSLSRLAEKAIPEGTSIWDKLETSYQAEQRTVRFYLPKQAVAVLIAVIGFALVTTGGVFAFYLLGGFPNDAGSQTVADAGLGITLNRSQTVNGITLTLVQAYADEQRILLWYTLSGIDPTQFNRRAPDAELEESLYQDGQVIAEQRVGEFNYHYNRSEGEVLLLSAFRHDSISETLNLQWTLNISKLEDVTDSQFQFNFSVPVIRELLIPVNERLEVDGIVVNLESLAVTASSVTATLCADLPADYDEPRFDEMGLLYDGELYIKTMETSRYENGSYCLSQSFDVGVLGSETLQITTASLMSAAIPNQGDIERAIVEMQALGIEANANYENIFSYEVMSYPENMSEIEALRLFEASLYSKVQINHTFTINLSDLVISQNR